MDEQVAPGVGDQQPVHDRDVGAGTTAGDGAVGADPQVLGVVPLGDCDQRVGDPDPGAVGGAGVVPGHRVAGVELLHHDLLRGAERRVDAGQVIAGDGDPNVVLVPDRQHPPGPDIQARHHLERAVDDPDDALTRADLVVLRAGEGDRVRQDACPADVTGDEVHRGDLATAWCGRVLEQSHRQHTVVVGSLGPRARLGGEPQAPAGLPGRAVQGRQAPSGGDHEILPDLPRALRLRHRGGRPGRFQRGELRGSGVGVRLTGAGGQHERAAEQTDEQGGGR
ncbi:hypothetical protein [Nocardioides sambongensis]|uniref:hypothetical protein n=1 Tax=Nocardioides sambongensis TaxID=2589074 RepID=UPI00112B3DA6|nr:hypothetical protein [Nocardioides sambongensis]